LQKFQKAYGEGIKEFTTVIIPHVIDYLISKSLGLEIMYIQGPYVQPDQQNRQNNEL
jgi:hypothetical protein